ncbi:MAG: crotonase/enoyl-CoA hydratase family protein [Gammaproteobacteria bacterium]|nr:crotonase/enoyl-CoA hydratase family protein [Gammaproteobacteria bacterium]MDH3749219.1 crotonase/enoyl-CoA hydratase family protein [Gammaproteobacteria bacterium]
MSEPVTLSIDGHIAQVMLNRPDKANALNLEMFDALGDAGKKLASDRSLRAVILHGAGANFCAGIDVDLFRQGDVIVDAQSMAPVAPSPANRFQRAAYAWRELPIPVICAITGVAYGGGLQIALGADLRYAAGDARLSIMEIKWGLIPDMAISTTLRDILPVDRVKELAWSGRPVGGEEALRLGIVTALHDDPLGAAKEMATALCAKSPDAIRSMKRLFNAAWQMPEADALALEAKLQMGVFGKQNQLEAVMANIEKRVPDFRD